MATVKEPTPPRPIVPGDVVAAFSEYLGEWTAAQITHLDPDHQRAGVLHLDWPGPEPTSVAELGEVVPLWGPFGPAHYHYEWVLPRSYQVIGTLPLLHGQPPSSYRTYPQCIGLRPGGEADLWLGGAERRRSLPAGSRPGGPATRCTGGALRRRWTSVNTLCRNFVTKTTCA